MTFSCFHNSLNYFIFPINIFNFFLSVLYIVLNTNTLCRTWIPYTFLDVPYKYREGLLDYIQFNAGPFFQLLIYSTMYITQNEFK